MLAWMAWARSSLTYGGCHSSEASITPSRVKNSATISFRIGIAPLHLPGRNTRWAGDELFAFSCAAQCTAHGLPCPGCLDRSLFAQGGQEHHPADSNRVQSCQRSPPEYH